MGLDLDKWESRSTGDYNHMNILLRLLGQEDRVNARNHSTRSDGDPRHHLVDLNRR